MHSIDTEMGHRYYAYQACSEHQAPIGINVMLIRHLIYIAVRNLTPNIVKSKATAGNGGQSF